MADERIFTLVGRFDDKITPSLAKLSKSISGLTRDFEKLKRGLRPIAKDMAIMADGANRIADGFRSQRSSIDSTVKGLTEYRREMGKATAAQQKFQKSVKLPTFSGGAGPGGTPRGPRGVGGGKSRASGGAPGEVGGLQKMGLGAMTVAGAAVGVGFTAATAALNGIRGAVNGFVQSGSQAQQAVIQMAGTLQTLGKVGDFKKSQEMAEGMMKSLSKVASALPGSTEDYLTILQQTLDDQIQAFGSVQAVQQNLQGLGKDGKKLAGGMEQSFTALFGMASQVAGLAPQVAAMDLNQLRMSPTNIKQVQVLSRNPTLAKFYLEELKKSGGNFIMALNEAMKKAITPEQVEALKNSFDSAYQSFVTTFTDSYSGILAPMRKVSIQIATNINGVAGTMEKSVTSMELLGVLMRNINDIIAVLLGTGIDPLVMLNQFLYELGYQAYKLKMDLEGFAKDGLGIDEFGESIGRAIGDAAGNFSTWLMNLDYEKFFKGVDKLVFGFFKGLFSAFLESFKGVEGENKGLLGGLGTSVAGTVVSLLALAKVVSVAASAFSAISGVVTTITAIGPGILTVVQVGFPMLMSGLASAASAFTAAALPALAIAGALLGLFAIFRHGDFILSSLWESVQLVVNGLTWLNQSFQLLIAQMAAGILDFMSKLPLVGDKFKDAAANANAAAIKVAQNRLETEKKIAANTKKIGENTANSLKRTKEDLAKIGGAFKGATPKKEDKKKQGAKQKPVMPNLGLKKDQGKATTPGQAKSYETVQPSFAPAKPQPTPAVPQQGSTPQPPAFQAWQSWFAGLPAQLSAAWRGVQTWFSNLPTTLGSALGTVIGTLQGWGDRFSAWALSLPEKFNQISVSIQQVSASLPGRFAQLVESVKKGFADLVAKTVAFVRGINWSEVGSSIKNGLMSALRVALAMMNPGAAIAGWIKGAMNNPALQKSISQSQQAARASASGASAKPANARRRWDGKGANSMPLHSAIASEMANKPPGSDLVIANSSETIIPAAGGLGSMDGFVNAIYGAAQNTASVFSAGFQSFSQRIASGQQATVAAINKGTQTASVQNATMLSKLTAQNAALMGKMTAVAAAAGNAGMGGGMALGGGYGSRGSQIAGALGNYIKKTGGAPGSIHEHPQHGGVKGRHSPNSYHYQGRAIDIGAYAYEQGGVLRRVAQFNAQMGVKPVELLKAGDPGHSDHVHVAYALGAGNPAFFNSADAADKWESMMAGKNPIVSSVRAQANEVRGGGTMTVNAPITINQQPGQDSDQLASLVAIKLTQAVNQLRYSSYNV